MTQTELEYLSNLLPYGDGNDKIFGMENFGNTCYCNSILQCLYFTEKFRVQLISHRKTQHDRKSNLYGIKTHNFSNKYEMLVQKRTKEQKNTDDKNKSRKGSLFGIKFSGNNNSLANTSSLSDNDIPDKKNFIFELQNCHYLSEEQKNFIHNYNNGDFKKINVMVTRPLQNFDDIGNKNDYSQSSSMLLNSESQQSESQLLSKEDNQVSSQSSFILIGIPYPETFLTNPINPFNPSPTSDQRKRSALINGPIVNLDHSLQLPSEQNEDSALLYALKDLFESMVENKSNIGVVSPQFFISKLKDKNYLFRQNNMHHDAHEFCNYLINEIIECLNKENGFENNWCNNLFQGVITNETRCLSCETKTSKEETFLDLSIDIPPHSHSNSLTSLLNNFSKQEILTHQNKFYCNSCSSLQEAIKTIKINRLPEVLVVNFKRFKYDERLDKLIKLFDSISYPMKLRLFNTAGDEDHEANNFQLYELYSLVVHIGGGPMHGHYISLCKIKANLWLLFDDETVEIVDESYVMKFFGNGPGLASAYILFYQKCEYLDPGEEDKMDFGFDINDIYNGNDYKMNFTNTADVNHSSNDDGDNEVTTLDSSNKKNSSISSKQLDDSTETSIDNLNNSSAIPVKKSSSIFKKNFKLDSSNTPSVSSISNTSAATPSINNTVPSTISSNVGVSKNGSARQRNLSNSSNGINPFLSAVAEETTVDPAVKEKKSWVGGLRKDSKREIRTERSGSTGSITLNSSEKEKKPEKERKKSIFGFKRK